MGLFSGQGAQDGPTKVWLTWHNENGNWFATVPGHFPDGSNLTGIVTMINGVILNDKCYSIKGSKQGSNSRIKSNVCWHGRHDVVFPVETSRVGNSSNSVTLQSGMWSDPQFKSNIQGRGGRYVKVVFAYLRKMTITPGSASNNQFVATGPEQTISVNDVAQLRIAGGAIIHGWSTPIESIVGKGGADGLYFQQHGYSEVVDQNRTIPMKMQDGSITSVPRVYRYPAWPSARMLNPNQPQEAALIEKCKESYHAIEAWLEQHWQDKSESYNRLPDNQQYQQAQPQAPQAPQAQPQAPQAQPKAPQAPQAQPQAPQAQPQAPQAQPQDGWKDEDDLPF